ncbi:uridine kinase family protein [Acutalibacter intestini]|uniref:uridine kinase family protein n=1 Tax=Acutalibacter intestini TaxID=3093659 RepID=UPI002AC9834B|nr:nucleoside kinase [Acutalibacter sp. M00204]
MSNFASGYIKYINHLEQINDAAIASPAKMVEEVEGSYREHLRNIARNITERRTPVRIVMLSGPSSSGKTTTAHLLRDYLGDFGVRAVIISLDDFYLGADRVPRLPDGSADFETVAALDEKRICACLQDIFATGKFSVPQYSFTLGRPEGEDRQYELGPRDVAIVEGIHGLNPIFTRDLPEEACLKLYVSVKQQIKDANGEVISPWDLRLVRRIVRDIQFRNAPAELTLSMWPQVVEGENRYIRPYRMSADYTVNSIHIYEPCVLRTLAIPLLRAIAADSLYYKKARDLESRLMRFEPIPLDLVPDSSMLREFLGKRPEPL